MVTVAVQEDVDAILVSSYQGGHNEYFRYIIDSLKAQNANDILVFGGGGGVILLSEIEALQNYGVERLYHALDGQKIGIDGISDDIINKIKLFKENKVKHSHIVEDIITSNNTENHLSISRQLSFLETNADNEEILSKIRDLYKKYDKGKSLVLGVTGTGGSGKSSLIDEIIGRFNSFTDNIKIGVLAVDPSKSRTGGALLGDRIRYNQIYNLKFISEALQPVRVILKLENPSLIPLQRLICGFDIIIVETSGIGQGNSRIADISDYSMYIMTAEFGAPSQLEKIDMLDIANFIAINKFEKRGSEDALREVIIHHLRTHNIRVLSERHLKKMVCRFIR